MTILVPEFPIWTPEWEWPEWTKRNKARADKFIAAAIYGGGGGGLDTTITAARWLSDTFTTGPPTDENDFFIYCRGYSDHPDYFNATGVAGGSIAAGNTYQDGADVTRTIEHVGYYEPDGLQTLPEDGLAFGLSGTSIANDDDKFISIEVELSTGGNQTYARTSATYDASQSGMTMWIWEDIAHNNHFLVANNPHDFVVNV